MQWILVHLPLTAAVAAMGAASVDLVEQAHEPRTPAATSWVLCGGAAVVLCATTVLMTSLRVWNLERVFYRPLARTCVAVALAAVSLGAVRPTPLVLGLALVILLAIPWGLAVAHRLSNEAEPASGKPSEGQEHQEDDNRC